MHARAKLTCSCSCLRLGDAIGRKTAYGATLMIMIIFGAAQGLSFGNTAEAGGQCQAAGSNQLVFQWDALSQARMTYFDRNKAPDSNQGKVLSHAHSKSSAFKHFSKPG